jgi:2-C-methyl-D-erythritol 4-phosphate cytidylyltransferase
LLEWSAAALAQTPEVAAVQCVLPPGTPVDMAAVRAAVAGHAELLEPVEGGARRQDSVARGLEAARAARPDLAWVLVHDAARCLVEPRAARAALVAGGRPARRCRCCRPATP